MSAFASSIGVLSHAELQVSNRLMLSPRRPFSGSVKGERATRRKGTSIEFADYREYADGDDLRHLDWNVLARLDQPVLRTFLDEQDLAVHAILDRSKSMDFGAPTKFVFGSKLAAILGLAALNGGDALYPHDPSSPAPARAMRGRANAGHWLRQTETWTPISTRSIAAVVQSIASSGRRRGVAIIVSDGFDPDLPPALAALGSSGFEILFAHVLSAMDVDPDLEGDLELIDAESDDRRDVTANRSALAEYRANLAAHNQRIETTVRRVGGRYLAFRSDESVEVAAVRRLEKHGWVRR